MVNALRTLGAFGILILCPSCTREPNREASGASSRAVAAPPTQTALPVSPAPATPSAAGPTPSAASSGAGLPGAARIESGSAGNPGSKKTAVPFPTLPYRGLSLGGAEFAASIGGTFTANNIGTIPGAYYYPDKDWPDDIHYPGGYGKNAYPYYRSKGMNTFRLPFRWERLQRKLNADFDPNELAHLRETVRDMEAAGAFVLLDVHNYMRYASAAQIASGAYADTIGSRGVPYSAFADLWRRLADLYKDDPNILFGLMNEPMGIDDLFQWFHAANAAIAAIRATGAKNLILVGGNEYESAERWPFVSDMLRDIKDPGNNFAYEVHAYPDAGGAGADDKCPDPKAGSKRLQPFTAWARERKAKGFLGEFSAGISIKADPNCMLALDDQITHLEKNSDVYIGWTYWAGGQGFGDSPMEHSVVYKQNTPQMDVLVKHLK